MPVETKIDCATKKDLSLSEKYSHMQQLLQGIRCLRVTISFVCHLQPNQIYGNLVTDIPKS
jgi:hypothetical protein